MLRSIVAIAFLVGMLTNTSPAIAGVEEDSGSQSESRIAEVIASEVENSPVVAMNEDTQATEEMVEADVEVVEQQPVQQTVRRTAPSSNAMLEASSGTSQSSSLVSITPMFGTSMYRGRWNDHIDNNFTLGLILEIGLGESFAIEAEGGYANYDISYAYFLHQFNMYTVGGNAKVYLMRGVFNPYIGAGAVGALYSGMSHGPVRPDYYNEWVGLGQLIAGADVAVTEKLSLGIRGAYLTPVFNKPTVYHNGFVAYPYYEEASAMNTDMFKVMGTVKVSL